MSKRLLIVEPSSTMRYVLGNLLVDEGYEVDQFADFAAATEALKAQFLRFDSDYHCVLFGWPAVRDADARRFVEWLEQPDYHDLPVVVLAQEMRADSRAWVAGRDRSVLLRWKDYRDVSERLLALLDDSLAEQESAAASAAVKFSNDDIRILVVDDAASIRFALRQLLQQQGYDVTVVSDHEQAIAAATSEPFDIAVLDYYLQDSTGDELCRELIEDPRSGDITCAILTGTYADHIIKSSLRAGAIECMFKNESSELLLARIDAISRLVRQRKVLLHEHQKINSVIDSMAGALLVFNLDGTIVFANDRAKRMLGHTEDLSLLGQPVDQVVSEELRDAVLSQRRSGLFRHQERDAVAVHYICAELQLQGRQDGTIVQFSAATGAGDAEPAIAAAAPSALPDAADELASKANGFATGTAGVAGSASAALVEDNLVMPSADQALRDFREALIAKLAQRHLREGNTLDAVAGPNVSLLTLRLLDDPSAGALDLPRLHQALLAVYEPANHLMTLGRDQLAFLLEHRDEAHALMQARRLMQICTEMATDYGADDVRCCGCVLALSATQAGSPDELLALAQQGTAKASNAGGDCAYIWARDTMLPVYPAARTPLPPRNPMPIET